MAKKKTKINKVPTLGMVDSYKPRLYFDLEGEDVSQVKGLTVGETASFCVTGKVVGLEQSERTDEKGKMRKTGSIRLENYSVELEEEEDNEFKSMADED